MTLIDLKQIKDGMQIKQTAEQTATELESAKTKIDGLNTLVTEVEGTISALTTEIESVDAKVDAEITRATQAEEALSDRIDSLEQGEIHADDVIESEAKQFVSAAKKAQYDENTIFSADMLTVSALGGIAAGTDLNNMSVQEVLSKLLFPYVAPTLSVSGTPNGGTFEKGDNKTITAVRASVGKKSEAITKVEVKNGSTVLATKTGDEVKAGGNFDFAVNVPVNSNNVQLTVEVTDAANKMVSGRTGAFNFHYPYYMGVTSKDALTGDEIKALTKKIEGKGNKAHNFTTNNQRVVFAYPKAHGKLKTIFDANNFDSTKSFALTEVNITGLDGTEQPYYVYINGASTVTNFKFTFNY